MSRRADRYRSGFQLVELAVVLVVIGLMLAAAVPSFMRGDEWRRVEGAAANLSARIQTTRQMSVARRVPFRLVLDPGSRSYFFERQASDLTWVRDPEETYTADGTTSMSASIGGDETATEIYFEPRGTMRAVDVPAEIRFVSARHDTAIVAVVRTGRVSLRMIQSGE